MKFSDLMKNPSKEKRNYIKNLELKSIKHDFDVRKINVYDIKQDNPNNKKEFIIWFSSKKDLDKFYADKDLRNKMMDIDRVSFKFKFDYIRN